MSINTQAADAVEAGAFVIRGGFWCKGYYAKDADKDLVEWDAQSACSWCGVGSLYAQFDGTNSVAIRRAEQALSDAVGDHFPAWQDEPGRTAEEVADAMEAAAAALRGRE